MTSDDPAGHAHRPHRPTTAVLRCFRFDSHAALIRPSHSLHMSVIARGRPAIELHTGLSLSDGLPGRVWLRATGDGWSLLDPAGKVLFQGMGASSRRHCLEFARSRGVLAVLS